MKMFIQAWECVLQASKNVNWYNFSKGQFGDVYKKFKNKRSLGQAILLLGIYPKPFLIPKDECVHTNCNTDYIS